MKLKTIAKFATLGLVLTLTGCGNKNQSYSRTTGWSYNDKSRTKFTSDYLKSVPGGMVAIQGGSVIVGERDEYITPQQSIRPHRVTVGSFYMDEYEIRNIDWHEYINWLKVVFGQTAPKIVEKAQPDYNVWRGVSAYNEPYLQNYFIHPAFDQYPVVGVTWEQAMDYCAWRSDRVHELALIKTKAIQVPNFRNMAKQLNYDSIVNKYAFTTQKFLTETTYDPIADLKASERNAGKMDLTVGVLSSDYRLPTEAEWEYAAYTVTMDKNGNVADGKVYPWAASQAKTKSRKKLGQLQANYIRGRGDMMGTLNNMDSRASTTVPVNSYMPNDFGLYNMAGNVNEWVLDVYRPTSANGAANYSFDLGDSSELANLTDSTKTDPTDVLRPRITNKSRVYKGGSWKDRVYWLNPSTRRYLEQDKSANDIGFRCAMSMVGPVIRKK